MPTTLTRPRRATTDIASAIVGSTPDEVEHRVDTVPAGGLADAVDLALAAGDRDGTVGAGTLHGALLGVGRDDRGAGQRRQDLHRDLSEAAESDDQGLRATA
ncbi:MAG: hypothetical protein JWR27_2199 [Aeromicrobium sp.]|jgi:hypothetical protein|nr:hypothetical protein [Aeromicrobium sp.]